MQHASQFKSFIQTSTYTMLVLILMLACPQTVVCVERKHTVCTCSVPTGFLGFCKISWNLLQYNMWWRCLPLTMLCVDDDKGALKTLSLLLAASHRCPFQLNGSNTNDAIFHVEAHQSPQTKCAKWYHEFSDFCKTNPACSLVIQQVSWKWPDFYCSRVVYRLLGELGTCACSVYQSPFPLHTKALGMRLYYNVY